MGHQHPTPPHWPSNRAAGGEGCHRCRLKGRHAPQRGLALHHELDAVLLGEERVHVPVQDEGGQDGVLEVRHRDPVRPRLLP